MKKLVVLTIPFALVFFAPQNAMSQANKATSFSKLAPDQQNVFCRKALSKAGLIAKGRGAKTKNVRSVDECVKNGGKV